MSEHVEINDLPDEKVDSNEQNDISDALVNEVLDDGFENQVFPGNSASDGKVPRDREDEIPNVFNLKDGSGSGRAVDDIISGGVIGKISNPRDYKPSDKDIAEAMEMVDKEISKLIPREDRDRI